MYIYIYIISIRNEICITTLNTMQNTKEQACVSTHYSVDGILVDQIFQDTTRYAKDTHYDYDYDSLLRYKYIFNIYKPIMSIHGIYASMNRIPNPHLKQNKTFNNIQNKVDS